MATISSFDTAPRLEPNEGNGIGKEAGKTETNNMRKRVLTV